jgi:maltose alpha-D-glucosyltransferase/alpha-amylase
MRIESIASEVVTMPDTGVLRTQPAVAEAARGSLWYKDAVIYQTHVKAFFDSNDDGIGDFKGLTAKLDYIRDLGVTAIWLLPFYPSPLRDDGYDIADYRNVHPSYGSLADFKQFVKEAHRRDLRIVTELVINHTSDQHPWFQRARRARPGSRLRDFYVWSDTDQRYQGTRIIFLDNERSNWTWDPVAQAYYWHRFYSHQPDLNFDNPRVFRAIANAMRFWLDLGVDGMRLDAVPYLIEREGTSNENLPETHEILKRLRAELDAHYTDRMLLAEANQWPEDVRAYFGDGDECHMAFHFPVMPRLYMAVATEDRIPITDIMRQTPDIPENCQWAIFLRNHDELTLEMVTDRERDYLWDFYAADRRARLNLGIRRRLAPLMENDRRKVELMKGLLFSLPGAPILYYGDEIGMGDNIFLGDRDGVRTPMQWTPDRNGGFSRADPARLYLPPIMDPVYGFQTVNVEAQSRTPGSLLNWMRRVITVRQTRRVFGRGSFRLLYPGNRKILAFLREHEDDTVLCVFNLASTAQAVELELGEFAGRTPVELFGRSEFPPIGELPYLLTLQGHNFFWFALERKAPSQAHWRMSSSPELVTLVVPKGWDDLLDRHNRTQFERDVLPPFLARQRWFAGKDRRIAAVEVESLEALGDLEEGVAIALVEAKLADGERQRYFLPLAADWTGEPPDRIANLRKFRRSGALEDAPERFALAALPHFQRTPAWQDPPENPVIRRIGGDQSNTSVLIEEYAVVKLYRRLHDGIHPEVEMMRFLMEQGFEAAPALYGTMERGGTTIAVLIQWLRNQGVAWSHALGYFRRFVEHEILGEAEAAGNGAPPADAEDYYFTLARQLGRRAGKMHVALCPEGTTDPAFAPEPITPDDLARWKDAVSRQASEVLPEIEQISAAQRRQVMDRISALPESVEALKTRYHGDFHLGQVLVVRNDFAIIDFEGEPMRPLAERRAKSSPLKDLAGMLRSFHYAEATIVRELSEVHPARSEAVEQHAAAWRRRTVSEFLAGYEEATRSCPSVPQDPDTRRALLGFFLIEKALYEIAYERANRPAWVAIPVAGLLELLEEESDASRT